MSKYKILTVVGTRPEIIRLSRCINSLDKKFNHVLVHTNQNYDYELNKIFFKDLDLKLPKYSINHKKKKIYDILSKNLIEIEKIIIKEKPDAFIILGDTNSALTSYVAKRNKIPLIHIEAGNRCFDESVPEEINRKIVDHLSDINMPLSEQARDYLIAEGIKPETVIKTGSPMMEVLNANMEKILDSKILETEGLVKGKYILMSIHREENVDSPKNFNQLLESIETISTVYEMPIIISTHPRTKKKLQEIGYDKKNKLLRFSKPYGFHEYNKLQLNAFCVISDSGTIAEESSILNLPAITIRNAHERPEGMDEGALIMSGLDKDRIIESVDVVTKQHDQDRAMKLVGDYDVDNVSKKVIRIILSYTDYINRTVWHKET